MSFSFSSLNLANITAATGGSVLPPGKYVTKIKDVELKPTKAGTGTVLAVRFVCDKGVITENLNVQNQSAEAQRIGLEQLKSMLICAGHVDPDNVGAHGFDAIKGLTVGIIVGSETYQGNPRSRVSGFCKPEVVGAASGAAAIPPASIANGDIPFIVNTLTADIGSSKERRMARYSF